MCRPIAENLVRPKKPALTVSPLWGSSPELLKAKKPVTLSPEDHGIAEGPDKKNLDYFIVLFQHGSHNCVRASVHHSDLKGIEA